MARTTRFNLTFDTAGGVPLWNYGGMQLRAAPPKQAASAEVQNGAAPLLLLVGRYRSYSPWFPTFRIVLRGSTPYLIAPGGVEAPSEDIELVALEPGVFRIGREPHLPERLTVGAVVDGKAITLYRDGCRYSRAFSD